MFQASSSLGSDDSRSKNEDERCSGITSSGQRCQRCITEDGGDAERALCRKCVVAENERVETAARLIEKIERQRSNERKKTSDSGVGGSSNRDALNGKRKGTPQRTRNGASRLGDMQAILAATAKQTARCSSCDVEYFLDTVKEHCSSQQTVLRYSRIRCAVFDHLRHGAEEKAPSRCPGGGCFGGASEAQGTAVGEGNEPDGRIAVGGSR